MNIAIRTDKPEAELYLLDGDRQLAKLTWLAHRQLAETLHTRIRDLLASHGYIWQDISGIVCYQGPGSFTGLRIGLSVANALADSLQVPIVGATTDNWLIAGLQELQANGNRKVVLPNYGAPVHITQQKK